jgi:hypothetical protein
VLQALAGVDAGVISRHAVFTKVRMRDCEIWRGVCGSRLTGVSSCSWRTGAPGETIRSTRGLRAPLYTEQRSTMAKQIGLGRPQQAVVPPLAPEVVAPATPRRGRKPRSAAAE